MSKLGNLARNAALGVGVCASVWALGRSIASAQTRCPDEVREALLAVRGEDERDDPDAPPGLDTLLDARVEPEGVACARIAGVDVLAGVLVVHPPEPEEGALGEEVPPRPDAPRADDVWLRVSTARGVLDVHLDALLRPFDEEVGWVDVAEVELQRERAAPGSMRVRVITQRGEDEGSTRETRLLVDVSGAPRLVYGGPASEEWSAMGYCVTGRVVRWTIRGGVLRVRTRVYRELIEANRPDDPDLEVSLREGCVRPRAFRADVPLD